jgi:hypothetical protein
MVGEIISERWATSNRNGGRDHLGILGEIKSVHPGEIIGISRLEGVNNKTRPTVGRILVMEASFLKVWDASDVQRRRKMNFPRGRNDYPAG